MRRQAILKLYELRHAGKTIDGSDLFEKMCFEMLTALRDAYDQNFELRSKERKRHGHTNRWEELNRREDAMNRISNQLRRGLGIQICIQEKEK